MADRKNVLVFIERREGEIKGSSLQAVGAASALAGSLGGEVVAVALGPGAGEAAGALGKCGVSTLFTLEAPEAELYAASLYGRAVAQAIESGQCGVALFAHSSMGRDVAPRVAAALGVPCASDLVEVAVSPEGELSGRRPVYSGKAFARIRIPDARPAIATLRPNVFRAASTDGPPAKVEALALEIDDQLLAVRTEEVASAGGEELDVAEASIVVSGGRGLKAPENFALIRELAQALGGAVGASRAVVDQGWIAHAHQVGQTGKVVSPELYIACGISGAVQHLAGMSSSKRIVAINKDADADIFKIADYGIVGDLFEVVPALTEEIRKLRGQG